MRRILTFKTGKVIPRFMVFYVAPTVYVLSPGLLLKRLCPTTCWLPSFRSFYFPLPSQAFKFVKKLKSPLFPLKFSVISFCYCINSPLPSSFLTTSWLKFSLFYLDVVLREAGCRFFCISFSLLRYYFRLCSIFAT